MRRQSRWTIKLHHKTTMSMDLGVKLLITNSITVKASYKIKFALKVIKGIPDLTVKYKLLYHSKVIVIIVRTYIFNR